MYVIVQASKLADINLLRIVQSVSLQLRTYMHACMRASIHACMRA